MKKKNFEILWNPNGWTVLQNADGEEHVLEISCLAENGKVVEIRKRHNDGEEIVQKKKVDDAHALPMAFDDFKAAFAKGEFSFK